MSEVNVQDHSKGELSVQEQVLALKMMTAKTGVLHEAQVQQLRLWPWLIFEGEITSFEIGVQPEPKSKYLEYRLIGAPEVKSLSKRKVDLIRAWVRNLFGRDWKVVVKLNGSVVEGQQNGSGRTRKRKGTRSKSRCRQAR